MQSDFSPWQIARLRRGLRAYRVMKARNGRPPIWERVAAEIEKASSSSAPHPETGLVFQGETLRRFAAGEQALKGNKPQDLCRFLIACGALLKEEMEGDDALVSEALAAHRIFACKDSRKVAGVPSVGTVWRAELSNSSVREHFTVSFLAEPMDDLALVEERTTVYSLEPSRHEPDRPDWQRTAEIVRRGCAFCTADPAFMYMLLRGHRADDHVHYIELNLDRTAPTCLRAGGTRYTSPTFRIEGQSPWMSASLMTFSRSRPHEEAARKGSDARPA